MNVFGDNPAAGLQSFQDNFGEGDDFKLLEHVGEAVIVTVKGPEQVETKLYGEKTAIKVDVIALEAGGPKEYKDVLIFNAAPVKQLTPLAGTTFAAQITTYKTKQGGQAPKFDAATEDQAKAAEAAWTQLKG